MAVWPCAKRELVDQGLHLVGQGSDTIDSAQAHLEQRLVPRRDETRHRLPQRGGALMRPLHQRPALLHQAAADEIDGQHPEQA